MTFHDEYWSDVTDAQRAYLMSITPARTGDTTKFDEGEYITWASMQKWVATDAVAVKSLPHNTTYWRYSWLPQNLRMKRGDPILIDAFDKLKETS